MKTLLGLEALGDDHDWTFWEELPKHHREECDVARRWSEVPYIIDGVLVYVDDVEAHYDRARRAGATILSEIEDGYPGRRYRVEDLEGHRWMFLQRP